MEPLGIQAARFELAGRVILFDQERNVREARIERAWDNGADVVVKLGGIDDRTAAEALAGFELRIPISERLPLGENEFYHSDLIGCEVVGKDGAVIGPVLDVVDFGAGPLLEVDDHGKELLIPFAKGIWREVDLASHRIAVEVPEGLRDL